MAPLNLLSCLFPLCLIAYEDTSVMRAAENQTHDLDLLTSFPNFIVSKSCSFSGTNSSVTSYVKPSVTTWSILISSSWYVTICTWVVLGGFCAIHSYLPIRLQFPVCSTLIDFSVRWTGLFHAEHIVGHSFICSFIYSSNTEHLLYTRHRARCWGFSSWMR